MPGRLVFSTTRTGGTTPTEAARIASNQMVSVAHTLAFGLGSKSWGYAGYDPSAGAGAGVLQVANLGTDGTGSSTLGVILTKNATAWAPASSESRLKDIQSDADVDQCWNLVRDIELKRYYYKDQDDKPGVSYMGPMADWLGAQDPELLIDTGRSDDDGPIHTYNQGLLDMKALAALSAALKRIEQLETKVAALEGGAH
jgi:hypothetical protein